MNLFAKIKSWNWGAIEAIAGVVAALAMLATVYYAARTITAASDAAAEARQDTETNRVQQITRFQGLVMSDCMQEYFEIRRETANDWRSASTSSDEKQAVQDLYSERMYGLYFEEYHLFRQDAIPTHVYTIWITGLKHRIEHPEEHYPRLKIDKYIAQDTNEDFNIFINKALNCKTDDEIEALVKKEAAEPPYD